jgi:phosphotransferase system HPr (HPr) family protein
MSHGKLNRVVMVANPQGLHARPANLIVKLLSQFQAKIEIIKDNERVDGKSILDLLTLGAPQGTNLIVEADGPDANSALEALAMLFASNFGETDEDHIPDS